MTVRKLPIGIQNFASLRNDGYLYVDKTAAVYRLAHEGRQYFLSRPRRFGKSLLLSTLRAYWEGRKELFAGLIIEELEKAEPNAWIAHPVFYIDFNRDNYRRSGALEGVLEAHLKEWEKQFGCEDPTASQAIRFQNLLRSAHEKTGHRCVILVDEYDKPLLYQTGYLTIIGYDSVTREYLLGFPNEEVKYGFLNSLMPEYIENYSTGSGKDITALRRLAERGDVDGIRDVFAALFASIPYTDSRTGFEHDFQTVIYLVFTLLGQYVHCEVHSANGRADCILETARYIYIFEFKRDGTAEEALRQIEEKGYALPYLSDVRKCYKIGAAFDSEKRTLKDWSVSDSHEV